MRRRHFETLRPVCPVCRPAGNTGYPLRLAQVTREDEPHIMEGALHCTNENCLREFPIVDGVPLLVANIRQYVSDNVLAICGRQDLSDAVESMLGDCCGPSSVFEQTRQQLSSYAWDHYGDLDPSEPAAALGPGSMRDNLLAGLQLAGPWPSGPVIDVGCSVGRSSFSLAERGDGLVLGVDLNFAMLRLASEVLRRGTVRYLRRRTGLVYDRREFPARFVNCEEVDFWACDATALPFPPGTFALAAGMNVLDCVHAPREFLASLAQTLKEGGKAILTCPYDWSPAATPLEGWLGGHSQRSPLAGSPEAVLRTLLTPKTNPGSVPTLELTAEQDKLTWHVRLHDRADMTYTVHLLVATKAPSAPR